MPTEMWVNIGSGNGLVLSRGFHWWEANIGSLKSCNIIRPQWVNSLTSFDAIWHNRTQSILVLQHLNQCWQYQCGPVTFTWGQFCRKCTSKILAILLYSPFDKCWVLYKALKKCFVVILLLGKIIRKWHLFMGALLLGRVLLIGQIRYSEWKWEQNGCHFTDNIVKCIFSKENFGIAIQIS